MAVKSRSVLREQFLGTDAQDHNRDLVDSVAVGAATDAITGAATDAITAHSLNTIYSASNTGAALNALGTKLNAQITATNALGTALNAQAATLNEILVALRAYGIVTESEE